jgi:hypothetical protein
MVELPSWAGRLSPELKKTSYRFWQKSENREKYLSEWAGLEPREIQRKVLFAEFEIDPKGVFGNPADQVILQPCLILFVYGREVKTFVLKEEELKDV